MKKCQKAISTSSTKKLFMNQKQNSQKLSWKKGNERKKWAKLFLRRTLLRSKFHEPLEQGNTFQSFEGQNISIELQ